MTTLWKLVTLQMNCFFFGREGTANASSESECGLLEPSVEEPYQCFLSLDGEWGEESLKCLEEGEVENQKHQSECFDNITNTQKSHVEEKQKSEKEEVKESSQRKRRVNMSVGTGPDPRFLERGGGHSPWKRL